MPFTRAQAKVAHNMIDEIDSAPRKPDSPFTNFAHCWAAFNEIYRTVKRAATAGSSGLPPDWLMLAEVQTVFDQPLREAILTSDEFRFFLNRVPQWNYMDVAPAGGVIPNGVVNLSKSEFAGRLILCQIDRVKYAAWIAAPGPGQNCIDLIKQIVDVVYTVRCNTLHGGKETTDGNAVEVVHTAYRLVRRIVDDFLVR